MARITPSTGEFVQLEDFEPYKFTFKSYEFGYGDPKYGTKRRVEVHLAVNGNEDDLVYDWLNCAINKQAGTGAPSKLTEFLNAFAGKPAGTELAFFDDETGEWGYEEEKTYGRLNDLLEHEVIGRGQNKPREDGANRYRIQHYQSATTKAKSNGGKARPAPATAEVADVDPAEVPF